MIIGKYILLNMSLGNNASHLEKKHIIIMRVICYFKFYLNRERETGDLCLIILQYNKTAKLNLLATTENVCYFFHAK